MQKRGPKNRSPEERFWRNVVKQEDGCWLFRGNPGKYGVLNVHGVNTLAHRFSYTMHKGEIGVGRFVCHTCDVRGCVNPDHLYSGTHEDNVRDIVERRRHYTPRSIEFVERQKAMNPDERAALKADYETGKWTQLQLARKYQVSQATVSATIRGVHNNGKGEHSKQRTGHFRRKLTPEQLTEIQTLYATGNHTQTELASRFNCHQTRISVIISRGY